MTYLERLLGIALIGNGSIVPVLSLVKRSCGIMLLLH